MSDNKGSWGFFFVFFFHTQEVILRRKKEKRKWWVEKIRITWLGLCFSQPKNVVGSFFDGPKVIKTNKKFPIFIDKVNVFLKFIEESKVGNEDGVKSWIWIENVGISMLYQWLWPAWETWQNSKIHLVWQGLLGLRCFTFAGVLEPASLFQILWKISFAKLLFFLCK